jgi:hypothetical protein
VSWQNQIQTLMLNWDPGNAAMAGETPYPSGYDLLPKDRHWPLSLQRRPGGMVLNENGQRLGGHD